ncbi:serine hydrolase [Cytophagaceae bacterium DM2B3-1]|uniref:Serine hydrolase n=1 Tax=Xanthocytophaga flava TaxID=3048013 RepID=A0ABT7CKS6_9BACT|nr:serine hydrolase [Xanthocytophaga flavus]MDJ1469792.1 serine hydrolase [Xanthocytophaga flavus]MDJ1494305.1 serine hydrolase [Xanthocytophaga flavus]
MKKTSNLLIIQLIFFSCLFMQVTAYGQTSDLVKSEGITSPLHQTNVGRITFMSKGIPVEEYKETDFLKTFEIKEGIDLNIRTYLGNSLTNYLHPLAPKLTADEVNALGNYQFSFYVDNSLIYKENLHPGAGLPENKKTKTVFQIPLISSTNADSWGRYLWGRFMAYGGEDALTVGKPHLLKIEIRPYVKNPDLVAGNIIAHGEITLTVTKPQVDPAKLQPQAIQPSSGFSLSNLKYDKEKIKELNQKIEDKTFKQITSIVVLKDGQLVLEEYFNGATRTTLHDPRSVGKTFASAAMGIAIKDGYIKNENQTLGQFYNLKEFSNYSVRKDSVTLRSLLMMSSGFDGSDNNSESPGNEENMYPTNNWVKFALDLPMDKAKVMEKNWDYFTAGVVVLGDVIHKSVPGGLEKYADEKLFKPLGIKNYKWQYTPQHVANTAGGIQLASLDFARFGQLYLNDGKWNNKQILPQKWVNSSLAKQVALPDGSGSYGYLFWNKTYKVGNASYETYYCSGNGGNKIFIFKELGLVVVVTATAYNTPYAHPQVDKIIQRYILPAVVTGNTTVSSGK